LPYLNSDPVFDSLHRCTNCLLPDTFPQITFDSKGVCNYCTGYVPFVEKGETQFLNFLSKFRGKGKEYDCIAPISGGRDSAFVLHQMVTRYKLRTLALTVDSGFITEDGYRNIKTITEKLGVDHVFISDEKQIEDARKTLLMKFQGWINNPSIHNIVPVLNSGDKLMNYRMFKYASQNQIPLLLGGNVVGTSSFEHGLTRTGFLGIFPDDRGVYSFFDKMRIILYYGLDFLKNPYNWHPLIFKEYLTGAFVYFFDYLLKPNNVDVLGFYDYIPWKEEQIVNTITSELGWKGAKDTSSTWRNDDSAYPLINYLNFYLTGLEEHVELYSKMIRAGQISRVEAYEKCKKASRPRLPSLNLGLSELDVTEGDLHKALEKYRKEMTNQYFRGTSFESIEFSYMDGSP
jgi:glutamine---fructose-6-phosphate transaminase (isomerizing)